MHGDPNLNFSTVCKKKTRNIMDQFFNGEMVRKWMQSSIFPHYFFHIIFVHPGVYNEVFLAKFLSYSVFFLKLLLNTLKV